MPELNIDRRDRLAELVRRRGFVRVRDAADLLGVSDVTIRGDLSALETAGELVRIHGGAMPTRAGDAQPAEFALEQSVALAVDAKERIGIAAAALVSSGQSIILDVGSTALAVANALVRRDDLADISIITNGLSIALALEAALPRFTVVLTGGTLRPLQHSLVNPGASAFLESVHADLAIIGCNGIDRANGVTNVNFPEAEIKRRMLASSTRRVLVADAEKLGQTHLGVIGAVTDFDVLITSEAADPATVESLRAAGLDVLLAASSPV
ncbi:MAG TPA: DeoR/GlpR family DNA-binding transcription regulator [Galbitalea sp.]|jgi:DeoR family transcriptional regulator of aga operon